MKTSKDNCSLNDSYCVAKYGPKWVRTRTIFENRDPHWNEQYTWQVYDPCTVLTIGVFDNRHLFPAGANQVLKDLSIGKVRIRLSTLESNRIYTNAYLLLGVTPMGIKKMGELELMIRLSSTTAVGMMSVYLEPQLPSMHFFYPIHSQHQEMLRVAAMNTVALQLMQSEPPLRQEVVHFMLDTKGEPWSMRRRKENYYRIMGVLSNALVIMNWFTDICMWKSPVNTVLVHILFLILVRYPKLLLPTIFLSIFLNVAWNYRFRTQTLPFVDAKLSQLGGHIDEFEEEFDLVSANKVEEILKLRYFRLRSVAKRVQNAIGYLADIGEKLQSLFDWRDPKYMEQFSF